MSTDILFPAPENRRNADDMGKPSDIAEWVDRPTKSGWWLWREGGRDREEKLLLTDGGRYVATDSEWEEATNEKVEENGFNRNPWAMTATTKKMMPGKWKFLYSVLTFPFTP